MKWRRLATVGKVMLKPAEVVIAEVSRLVLEPDEILVVRAVWWDHNEIWDFIAWADSTPIKDRYIVIEGDVVLDKVKVLRSDFK